PGRGLEHVVGAGRHCRRIGVGKPFGRHKYQPAQAHRLHRARRRADVAGMLGADQDAADVVGRVQEFAHGADGKLRARPSRRSALSTRRPPRPHGVPPMLAPAVNVMVKAARAGGNVLLRHMHRLDALNVVEKDRMDYASEVDGLAEEAIIKELRRTNPDYAILGEEGGAQKGNRGPSRYTWVIDPLDGTSNYLHGIPHWCVSLALCEGPEP